MFYIYLLKWLTHAAVAVQIRSWTWEVWFGSETFAQKSPQEFQHSFLYDSLFYDLIIRNGFMTFGNNALKYFDNRLCRISNSLFYISLGISPFLNYLSMASRFYLPSQHMCKLPDLLSLTLNISSSLNYEIYTPKIILLTEV